MKPIRSILAATDLNAGSDDALRAAAALAALTGAELHLLHAFDLDDRPYTVGDNRPPTFQALLERVNAAFDAQIQKTVRNTPVASRELIIYVAHKAIVERAAVVDADLVVLGRHRERAVNTPFLGSTADRVLRTLTMPCLITGSPLRMPLQRVVVPIDLSEPALRALDVAVGWVGYLGPQDTAAELAVLHVIPQVFDASDVPINVETIADTLRAEVEASIERNIEGRSLHITEEIRWSDSVPEEINRFLIADSADMVIVGTHGQHALRRVLIGSVATAVARSAPCPVLLVPAAMLQNAD